MEFEDYSKKPKKKSMSTLSTSYTYNTAPIRKKSDTISNDSIQALDYQIGDQVKHLKFGVGTVKDIIKGPRDYQVTVDFGQTTGIKKMMAGFARLKKI